MEEAGPCLLEELKDGLPPEPVVEMPAVPEVKMPAVETSETWPKKKLPQEETLGEQALVPRQGQMTVEPQVDSVEPQVDSPVKGK